MLLLTVVDWIARRVGVVCIGGAVTQRAATNDTETDHADADEKADGAEQRADDRDRVVVRVTLLVLVRGAFGVGVGGRRDLILTVREIVEAANRWRVRIHRFEQRILRRRRLRRLGRRLRRRRGRRRLARRRSGGVCRNQTIDDVLRIDRWQRRQRCRQCSFNRRRSLNRVFV